MEAPRPGWDASGNPVSYFSDDSSSAANTSSDRGTDTTADSVHSMGTRSGSASTSDDASASASNSQPAGNNDDAARERAANRIPTGPGLVNSTSANFPQTEAERSATLGNTPLPKSQSDNLSKYSDYKGKK